MAVLPTLGASNDVWDKDAYTRLRRITAAASVSLASIGQCADQLQTIQFTGSNGAVTTGALPTFSGGVRQGQTVAFYNSSNGIVTLPSTSILPAATVDIPVDGRARLTYHGDYWRLAA